MQAPALVDTGFGCLIGTWHVVNNRRTQDGAYETFEGTWKVTGHLDGGAIFEDYEGVLPDGRTWKVCGIWVLDREAAQWSHVYFTNLRAPDLAPLVGTISDGKGELFAVEDTDTGTVHVRFSYDIGANTGRWNQALSVDGGRTWDVNWTQTYTRLS